MAVGALPLVKQKFAEFRSCPVTGLQVDLAAERLIIANAVASIVALLIGGIGALLLTLTRWQAIHLLPPDWFYRILTAHGLDMLVVWIVFFEIAGLYFGATVMLNARLVTPKLAWGAFILMVAGAVITNVVVGSFLEPRFLGRGLGLSTLVVFVSMVFWGWVLGPVGMFLSAPLTMLVKIAAESDERSHWLGVLLGNGSGLKT